MLLGSRGQVVCSFRQPFLLKCQKAGEIRAVGQVSRLFKVLKRLVLIPQHQLTATVHQGLLVVRCDEPLEEAQAQAVFCAD